MLSIVRTDSDNPHFQRLVAELDSDLAIRDGDDHAFFAQFNKIDSIRHVIISYSVKEACGCGAMKEYDSQTMEIKRMFVSPDMRRQGIASSVLAALEKWAMELGYQKCILETGRVQPEAIGLYSRNNFSITPNYGPYADMESSVCFEKQLSE